MIRHIIDNKYIDLVDVDIGFKYACINCNDILIKYYLNQKYIPKIQHVYYLILNDDNGDTQVADLLDIFVCHGLKTDVHLYETLLLSPTQFGLAEKFINIDDKTKKIYNQAMFLPNTTQSKTTKQKK